MHGPDAPHSWRGASSDPTPRPIIATTLNGRESDSTGRSMRWWGCTDRSPPPSSQVLSSEARASTASSTSASRNTKTSPSLAVAPAAQADDFPVQPAGSAGTDTTSTPGTDRAAAAVPSVESSSTTITWSGRRLWPHRPASRFGRRSASLRAGMITETLRSCCGGAGSSRGGSRHRRTHPASQPPMTTQSKVGSYPRRTAFGRERMAAGMRQGSPAAWRRARWWASIARIRASACSTMGSG